MEKGKRKRVASSNPLVTSSNLRVTSSEPQVRRLKEACVVKRKLFLWIDFIII